VADLPTIMTCFNHITQRQTLNYLCVQPDKIKGIYEIFHSFLESTNRSDSGQLLVEIFLKPTEHISNFIGSAQISHRIGN
jgi:hypothetical protein